MLPPQTILAFMTASVLLALAPGPDNLFVLTQSLLHGARAGLVLTLGFSTGVLVHSAAVAFGVAAVIQASAVAFLVLKLLGAGYLLHLAWEAWRASPVQPGVESGRLLSPGRLYCRGILMNVTNPKVLIFFLAFLPQFVDPHHGPVMPQVLTLGGLFVLNTLIVFGGVALLAGTLGAWLSRSGRLQRWLNRTVALVFVAVALMLVLADR